MRWYTVKGVEINKLHKTAITSRKNSVAEAASAILLK
jgi:hypothetical protein